MTLKLVGQKFGKLVVQNRNVIKSLNGGIRWDCICDCGKTTVVIGSHLINGNTRSCGCLQKQTMSLIGKSNTTHGMTDTSEYVSWYSMIKRCTNPNDHAYENYGGRGITVCDRWLNSFENFYKDMGPKPSSDHSIERRENNNGYEPNNCYWGTRTEQCNNRRSNVFHTYNGITKTISEWSREYGIEYDKFYDRLIKLKWDFERVVTTL